MVVRIVSPLLVLSCLTAVCTAQPTEGTTPPPAVVAPNGAPGLVLPEFDAAADPAETIEKVEALWQTRIDAQTPLEANQLKVRVLEKIVSGSEVIIANQQADEKIAKRAIQNKMEALGVLAQAGDPTALTKAIAMAKAIAEDPRPLVAREGKLIMLSSRLNELQTLDAAGRQTFVKELIDLLVSGPLGQRELQIGSITAELLEQFEDLKSAQSIYEKLAEHSKNAESPELRARAEEFKGVARRLGLPGKEIEIAGTSLAGEEIDIKNYRGKVVLIQFWASWCGYCLQEMPQILKMKNTYGDDGFEVIGVNLDDAADRARAIIGDMMLPWPNLFSTDPATLGMSNPNATRYGIVSIPQCILVDREGKVVSLNARGENLPELLEKQFLKNKPAEEPATN